MHAVRMLNGVGSLGVVASKKRILKPGTQYDAYFPKPSYSDPLLTPSGENEDTISVFIPRIVRDTLADTKRIAVVLKGASIGETCARVFAFVYEHIQYHLDSPHEEQIRRPSRTWADRQRGVDCDCYTTFISSILTNLSIPHYLRMAAYSPNRGYQHIYVVVPKRGNVIAGRGSYWVIDPVLDRFDDEKSPMLYKQDQYMPVSAPLQAGTSGLSGFPIRHLNGAPKLRNNWVYDGVYYSPKLGTWALKGLDGGFYVNGDPNKRIVDTLNGLNGGLFKKIGNFAKKAGGGIVKSVAPIAANLVAPGSGNMISSLLNRGGGGDDSEDSVSPMSFNNSANTGASYANTGAGSDNTDALTKKIQAANKANVMSLNAVDKSMGSKLNAIAAELTKSAREGQSIRDTAQNIKAIAAASLARTESAEAKAEENAKQTNTMLQRMEGMSMTNKIMLVAIAVLVVLMVVYISKR